MEKIYFDNAATTPVDPEVTEAMIPVLKNVFGNPSSVHAYGREARALIEKSRKSIARHIKASPSTIFFTSGGTEADNMVIRCAADNLGVTHIISSPIEHHAVVHTVEQVRDNDGVKVDWVKLTKDGYVDMEHLEELLTTHENEKTLVSLMHANNEIGNLLPLEEVGRLCKEHGAYFHSDTVQTMGHYNFNVEELPVDFLTCSAHKFHGPKGIGFLYINNDVTLKPIITGGAQERNMRAGTENIYGIVGLEKAMEVAYRDLDDHRKHVEGLKSKMIKGLEEAIPEIEFNGDPKGESLYTVLNVRFPDSEMNEMFLYNLDIEGICVSGGSACSSGSNVGSHVLNALNYNMIRPSIRFSFSKFNTEKEVDHTLKVIKQLFSVSIE